MAEAAAAWEAVNNNLVTMMDVFTSMIRASRIPEEIDEKSAMDTIAELGATDKEAQAKRRRERPPPGDLLEVWPEKLLHIAHNALLEVGKLKSQANLADFDELMNRVRNTRTLLAGEDQQVSSKLNTMRKEVYEMMGKLEDSYYGCPHRGRPIEKDFSAELKELATIAMELAQTQSEQIEQAQPLAKLALKPAIQQQQGT